MILSRIAAALALAGAVLTAPAFAADPGATPARHVRFADLNLASDDGARLFEKRVALAAQSLCGGHDIRDLAGARADNACLAATIAEARPQMQLALDAARGGRAYAFDTIGLRRSGR